MNLDLDYIFWIKTKDETASLISPWSCSTPLARHESRFLNANTQNLGLE